ncbi:MAG: hypothetical protein JXA99_08065 [Candidatus Lokiarchaeota archaeon]|nr:hypothetical protein [Candidatus Lokiarchaeota archaeon]
MSNDANKIQISKLENELREKEEEINNHLDRIEYLENNILQLEALIKEAESEGKIDSEKFQNTQLKIGLEEKEKEIRVLKNNLGFLRKENMSLKKEIETIQKGETHTYSVMQKDVDNEPLHALIKELQTKINKQQTEISSLKNSTSSNKIQNLDFEKTLKEKNKIIDNLNIEIKNLKNKPHNIPIPSQSKKKVTSSFSNDLTEMLQDKLNKTRRQVEILENKLKDFEKQKNNNNSDLSGRDNIISELNAKNSQLQNKLEQKEDSIKTLKKTISDLEEAQSKIANDLGTGIISSLTDELQRQLNKSKYHIRALETKLEKYQNSSKLENDLENLKTKLETQDLILKEKEKTIDMIKIEATKSKEEIKKLKNYIDAVPEQKKVEEPPKLSSDMDLRFKELKIMIKDLEKLNAEQRLEIMQLRKS